MDPLSISASVAGLLTLAVQVLSTCDAFHASVKKRPKIFKALSNDLTSLQLVLSDLQKNLSGELAGDEAALLKCIRGCDEVLRDIWMELGTLQVMFERNLMIQAYAQITFKSKMESIMASRAQVEKYTHTMSFALAIRQSASTIQINAKLDQIQADLAQARSQTSRSVAWLNPILQYVEASTTVISTKKSSSVSVTGMPSSTILQGGNLSLNRTLSDGSPSNTDPVSSNATMDESLEIPISPVTMSKKEVSDGESSAIVFRASHALVPEREASVGYRNRGDLLRAKDLIWESLANQTLPPEESDMVVRRLQKTAEAPTLRSYIEGLPTSHVIESAIVVSVGFTFLPGADKAQVARFEQGDLTNNQPDQKSAMWRINTAATLLKRLEVTADLSLKEEDRTSDIAREARRRRVSRVSERDSVTEPMQQLALRDKLPSALTIDSKHVVIGNDLRGAKYDMEATLIEVDGASLLGLIVNYRYLISRTGVSMTFEENRNLLDTMIEDARRLCVRSPVLFRMSTRARIINSKNTRYGIDQYDQFRTISTSKGIKEIISISASYYDALGPEGGNVMNPRHIKPRFLQMIVLLLLFLNNDDLEDISRVLETTYRINAERAHIEILILKVIPLMSINPTLFLEALVPAVEGYRLEHSATEPRQPEYWDTLMKSLLYRGYILPAGIESLGRAQDSWIAKWPKHGCKSTKIFKHLQYTGDKLRTINEIMPVDLHPEDSFTELTVRLLNGREYTMDTRDIERVTTMSTGQYTIIDAEAGGRKVELEIEETHISVHLEQAVAKTNNIIDEINRLPATPRRKIRFSSRPSIGLLNNLDGSGRITKHVALLNQDVLASAYRFDGRKITRKDAWQKMAGIDRSIDYLLKDLERRAADYEDKRGSGHISQALQDARSTLELAQRARRRFGDEQDYSDEPIASVMYPTAETMGSSPLWHEYQAWYRSDQRLFYLKARIAPVTNVFWRQRDIVEISLEGHTAKYLAKPLNVDDFKKADEVQEGDHAALVGQYLMLAVRAEKPGVHAFLMTNYMRITGMEEEESVRSRSGANRTQPLNEQQEMCIL